MTLRPETAKLLIDKFGRRNLEDFIKKENNAEKIEGLTEGQARAILAFSNLDTRRNRIAQERSQGISAMDVSTWQKAFSEINPDYEIINPIKSQSLTRGNP